MAERHIRWGTVTAAVAVFLALVVSFLRLEVIGEQQQVNVAVLPFTAIGGDPDLGVLADGLMETITRRLSQFEGLNEELLVVPVTELRQRAIKTPTEALNAFSVDYAVEGSLQSEGERLRLVLTLVDTQRLRQLGTVTVDGAITKAFPLEQGAVTKVANLLNLRVRPSHIAAEDGPSSVTPSAYEFYYRGRGYLLESHETENLESAVAMFQRALEDDPQYALAHAGLGETYCRLYERESDPRWIDLAIESGQRALESNDQLVEVHIAQGHIRSRTGKHQQAVESFKAALELDPRNADAFEGLAGEYAQMQRLDEAIATYHQAIALRPVDWRMYRQLGRFYFNRRDYENAIEAFARVAQLTPGSAQGLLNLGAAFHASGRLAEAQDMYERSIAIEPRPFALSNLAKIFKDSRRYAEAARLREQAIAISPHSFELWGDLAGLYERLGDSRTAETYERAAELAVQAIQINPQRQDLHSEIAHYFAGADQPDKARHWLKRARERLNTASPVEAVINAATYARLGEQEQCIFWLKAGVGTPKGDEAARNSVWLNEQLGSTYLAKLIREPDYPHSRGAPKR